MILRIFNTLSNKAEQFVPLEQGKIKMYACGMTVYDLCHLGHARSMVAFDIVRRWLMVSGYDVTFVRNITDIDDKIIDRAVRNGETIKSLTDRMIDEMHADSKSLGVLQPTHEPRATDYVKEMLNMISVLMDKGLAYQAENGDVNFAVGKYPRYGHLSKMALGGLVVGEDNADAKDSHMDFALWKSNKEHEPDDAKWDSAFGVGRPGWHIECSAMSCALLGDTFDIHCGGADLKFPHHENEIAQSEGANGKPFAKTWMHNGFINIRGQKMAKSASNSLLIRDMLRDYHGEVIRFYVAHGHYRTAMNLKDESLPKAREALTTLYSTLRSVPPADVPIDWFEIYASRFKDAMDDDFNVPEAISILFEISNIANKTADPYYSGLLKSLGGVLGLLQENPKSFLQHGNHDTSTIVDLINKRNFAKDAKDWKAADAIRDRLKAMGVALNDTPMGTTWSSI